MDGFFLVKTEVSAVKKMKKKSVRTKSKGIGIKLIEAAISSIMRVIGTGIIKVIGTGIIKVMGTGIIKVMGTGIIKVIGISNIMKVIRTDSGAKAIACGI